MAKYLSPRQMALLSDADRAKADSLGREYQAQWDEVYRAHGLSAPPRMDGVDPRLYERQLALGIVNRIPNTATRPFPGNSITFRQIHNLEVAALERDIYRGFEDQIKSAGLVAANHPDTVAPGEAMRRVEKVDSGGIKYIEWIGALRDKNNPKLGQRSFIEDFKAPVFRAKIRNPDTHPGWFTGNARVSQGAVGYDQTPWQSAFQKWQIQQGYLG
jgi:hypothetical protein